VISERARTSLDRVFRQAARTRLSLRADSPCDIEAAGWDKLSARRHAREAGTIMVLTIAAMAFRLLAVVRFEDDAATRAHYCGSGASTVRDAFMEVGNLFCGAINQQLVEHFPDLGMSTPYLLNDASLRHLEALRPDHLAAYRVTVEGGARLGAALCVCARAPVDFEVSEQDQSADAGGAFELF
jgi:hypothetical protein